MNETDPDAHSPCSGENNKGINLWQNLYAHSLPDRPLGAWQRLDVHINAVARMASEFFEDLQTNDFAWNAGILHDIGKSADAFQAYLLRANGLDDSEYDGVGPGRINHSSAGAALAEEMFSETKNPLWRLLAYLVAGHHAGLPDYNSCDGGRGALEKRIEDGKKDLEKIRPSANEAKPLLRTLSMPPCFVKPENIHFWARMIFSSLVDADFLDTEAFMDQERASKRAGTPSLGDLKKALDQKMSEITSTCKDTPVNRLRREILDACRSAASCDPGLFSLTVPTGGGKTLSAMTFALDHALRHGKKRVIYVIPYTSIIEQTAVVLSEIFGADNVIEHHSNLDPEKETQRTRLASENWDAPIVITTNVQFFESLYSARTGRCRKLHNLIDSVIILDEAQMIPPELLTPCVAAINELSRNYGATVVLSTATQPALPNLDPATEIIPPNANLYERLQRTDICFPEDVNTPVSWKNLAHRLREHDQVLCIVNTRRDCYDLFHLMPEEGTIHLSALMCGQHRSRVIQTIKERLKNTEPLRVISTQLVEAGVDIDFPVVYRAFAGLDSIAQAAGRCNREGKLNDGKGLGKVHVFVPPKQAPRGLLQKGENKTRELCTLPDFDPQAPEFYTRYFDLFYNSVNDHGERFLKELTPDDFRVLGMAFRSVGRDFRLIDDKNQRPVFVRYGKSEELLQQLQDAGPSRDLLRKLQRYTVSLSVWVVEKMYVDNLVEEIKMGKSDKIGYFAQTPLSEYDETIGIDVFKCTPSIEGLIN